VRRPDGSGDLVGDALETYRGLLRVEFAAGDGGDDVEVLQAQPRALGSDREAGMVEREGGIRPGDQGVSGPGGGVGHAPTVTAEG